MSAFLSPPVTLDGRSVQGTGLEGGKTAGDTGTLPFAGEHLRSTACGRHACGGGADTAHRVGEGIGFDAAASPRWGRLRGHGSAAGRRPGGTPTMLREGTRPGDGQVLAGGW